MCVNDAIDHQIADRSGGTCVPSAHANIAYLACLYFFFQAEDGIRDYKVTGVQTCALPILLSDDRVASTLPNIYNEEQLIEFAKAPEAPSLSSDDMERVSELYAENFGIEEEDRKSVV